MKSIWGVVGLLVGGGILLAVNCDSLEPDSPNEPGPECTAEGATQCREAVVERCTFGYWIVWENCPKASPTEQCRLIGGEATCVCAEFDATSACADGN